MAKKVKYTQPLLGERNAAGDLILVPGAVVQILQDAAPVTVYSDEDGTEITTPAVPSGVASGSAGVSTRGELTVWLTPGSGYSGVSTVGQQATTFPIPDISPHPDDVQGPIAPGTYAVPSVATRAALTASGPLARTVVAEVGGAYRYDAASAATVDGWVTLAAPGGVGRFIFDESVLTLPIRGGGLDDWANFGEANSSCAAAGVTLRLGPGLYEAKTRNKMASGLHLVCTPTTRVKATLPQAGDPRDSPFCGDGVNGTTTTLASASNVGDKTVTLTADLGLAAGDFLSLFISGVSFQGAIYQVIAYNSGTKVVTLDRPLRIAYPNQLATTSFPAGAQVNKVTPARDILIEFNGARVYGAASRYLEFIRAWNCHATGPAYLGDGTSTTASERLASLDAPSFNCTASGLLGDGGLTTPIGYSEESGENDHFDSCVVTRCASVGMFFQNGIDCEARNVTSYANTGNGAEFGTASDNYIGTDGCRIVGGSYSKNGLHGIVVSSGSSRNEINGPSVIGNASDGIAFTASGSTWTLYDNLVTGNTIIRKNGSAGVEVQGASVRTRVSGGHLNDNAIGVTVLAGALGTSLTGADIARNTLEMNFAGDVDCSGVLSVAPAGATNSRLSVTAGKTRFRGGRLEMTSNAAPTVTVTGTGLLDIDHSDVVQVASGIGIQCNGASAAVRIGSGTRVTGHGNGGYGCFSVVGTIIVDRGVTVDGTSPFVSNGATGYFNFSNGGANALAHATIGATNVVVAYPQLKYSDIVTLERVSGSGAYTLAQTPGTGFTITGTTGDVFRWKIA